MLLIHTFCESTIISSVFPLYVSLITTLLYKTCQLSNELSTVWKEGFQVVGNFSGLWIVQREGNQNGCWTMLSGDFRYH